MNFPSRCSVKIHTSLYADKSTSFSSTSSFSIASNGHAGIHRLHTVQLELITAILSTISIALNGQAFKHRLQPLHFSLITFIAIYSASYTMCFAVKACIKFSTTVFGESPAIVTPFPFGFGVNDLYTFVGDASRPTFVCSTLISSAFHTAIFVLHALYTPATDIYLGLFSSFIAVNKHGVLNCILS